VVVRSRCYSTFLFLFNCCFVLLSFIINFAINILLNMKITQRCEAFNRFCAFLFKMLSAPTVVLRWLLLVMVVAACVNVDGDDIDTIEQVDSDLFGLIASGRLAAFSPLQKREMVEVMLANTPDESLALARQIATGADDVDDGLASLVTLVGDLEVVTAIGKTDSLTSWLDEKTDQGFRGTASPGGETTLRGFDHAADRARSGGGRVEEQDEDIEGVMAKKCKAKVREILEIAEDPDCTKKEFDLVDFAAKPLSNDNRMLLTDITETFTKCGMVVLRNAFPTVETAEFVRDYSQYVRGLQSGRISHDGTTTNGEPFFAFQLDSKRWDLLMPRELARPGMLMSAIVNMFFQQDQILGKEFAVHSLGSVLGMPGAPAMKWHRDAPHLFSDLFAKTKGNVFTSDLPPHSVTMIMPMLNMTRNHGPTEFCIGSKQAQMLEEARMVNLAAEFGSANATILEEHAEYLKCPNGYRRAPVTSPGDAVLFDFRTKHRVLPNKSNQTRALMYWGFSRQWYKDHNYLESRAFSAVGGERLKVPRDAARGSAFDRQIRKTILKQVKDIEGERFKAWASQDQSARYYLDENGFPILDENGTPLEEDKPEVYQPWLYDRGNGRTPAISFINDLLKSARFAVPTQVDCNGMVNDEACGRYKEIEAAMPQDVVDMPTVLMHNPARKSLFEWYEDIDGDGALTKRDYESQPTPEGTLTPEEWTGDMDERSFKQLRLLADADWNGEVTWDELKDFDHWHFNHPASEEMNFPTAVRNRARFSGMHGTSGGSSGEVDPESAWAESSKGDGDGRSTSNNKGEKVEL
jgi:ectoine hydroxylase-related dioxygenase (phytanoyl-CoA dioxygenase family)